MTIDSLPPDLQPLIQEHYLDHIFEDSLHSKLGSRRIAEREPFAIGLGETITKTRAGLMEAGGGDRVPVTGCSHAAPAV